MAKASLPTPSVALINYPSPQIADRLLVERYDHSLSHFGPRNLYTAIPTYGVEHPDTRRFPGFRLAHVKLVVADDWYDWYWVNDRLNQDAYNCEIDYPYGDTAYPRHTRTLLVSRASYAAIAFGTADPANALLLLVAEQTPRIGDETLDSLYVVSKRVYERLPGLPITTWIVDGETQTPAKVVAQKVTKASGSYGTTAPVQSPAAVSATGTITLTSPGVQGNKYTLYTNQGVAVVFEMDTGTAAVASSGGLVTFYANPTAGTVTLTTHAGVAHIFELVNGAATSGSTQVSIGVTKEMTAMNFAAAVNNNGNFTCTMPTTASVSITRVATGADNQTITFTGTPVQVETATAAGTVDSGGGTITITTTIALNDYVSTFTLNAYDAATAWAGTVRASGSWHATVTASYTVGGSGTAITLTAKPGVGHDTTLNMAIVDVSAGITAAPTSANTTAGCIAKTNFSGGVTGTTVTSGNTAVTIGGSTNASATALAAAINAHAAFAAVAVGALITITKLGSLYPTITVTGGNANPTSFTGGVEGEASVEYRPINDYYGDLITSSLPDYQTLTRTELSDVQYEYPRIITGIYSSALEMDGGQVKVTTHVVARANRRRTKQATTTVTYDASANLTYDAPFDPALIDIIYDGWFINLREQNVWLELNVEIRFNTNSQNPIYGYVGETFVQAGQGTFPTGTKIISCRIRPWKYGLYRKEVTTIEI